MEKPRKPDLSLRSIIDSHSNPFALIDEHFTIIAANKAYRDSYCNHRRQGGRPQVPCDIPSF